MSARRVGEYELPVLRGTNKNYIYGSFQVGILKHALKG